ncbi:MAG TPA: cellulase family glycosylhydrolase [Solirubrobacteraceae bacterium]|nr:cellulase family glycosylhydrolase [Solirubrobacteraceae bacterium]
MGVNFWSRAGGPRMWTERYSPEVVRAELDVLAARGCNVTRSFCYWPDFMPAPERLDPVALERFADFLAAHREREMTTIPTFIVGHMSGENWDPAWRGERDLYRDTWLVSQQAWFVERVARRFGADPAVSGWLLTNEMPIYGGPAPSRDVTAWARLLMHALRAAGAEQPASVGDGAWGIEVTGVDNGFSLRELAPLVDFLGPHVYPMSDDPVRHHSTAAFACLLAGDYQRPVVLEEFGVSSDFVSDENAAHYYRQVLHSTLFAGAEGWIAWNNCDFDELATQDPYRHHPFELHFGLTDRTGAPKPALGELSRFSALVADLPRAALAACAAPRQAAIVVPEHFERALPFASEADREDIRDVMLQSYAVGREADLRLGIARERHGFDAATRLYLLPSTRLLTAPGMTALRERLAAGATVYLSYFAGSTATQRGPWLYGLQETFGVRHALHYGLTDPIEADELLVRFVRPFGGIAAGEELPFAVAGTAHGRSYLPVEPAGAEVVAVDHHERPALLTRGSGAGTAVLCTFPLEYMAARTPRVNPEPTWRLYDALADIAGVERALRCADPRVSCTVASGDGVALANVTNLSAEVIDAVVEDGAGRRNHQLGPYDVHTFTRS